jgi:hypothetical protein
MRQHVNDTEVLTPDQRRGEVARLLAVGVLRLHSRAALAGAEGEPYGPKNLPDSDGNCLEVPTQIVLSVHTS